MSSMINRREVLQRVALLMGGALSAPAILGVLNGCSAKPSAVWKPEFLTPGQGGLVAEIADIMIPRTDTPGAKDVGVPAFIDIMLKDAYGKEGRERFLAGLAEFETQAHEEHGRAFLELDPAERAAQVRAVHDAALAAAPDQGQRPFILTMKELTLLGYFSSEVGATQVLQHKPIPGDYVACSPLAATGNGRAWATDVIRSF